MSLIRLENVNFSYAYTETPVLTDVSLDIEKGKLYGVVGLNASGKSTLCALLRGLIPHFHEGELTGSVSILGVDVREWEAAELAKHIGFVFDNPFTQISGIRSTVFEEIALGLESLGVSREVMIDRVVAVAQRLGITNLLDRAPTALSGGQRQKVAFASVIAMDADVLIIDEPTSQLDPESSDEIFKIIAELKGRGKTIVLAEHKADLLAQHADVIVVMERGRVALQGEARSIFTQDALDATGALRPEVVTIGRALQSRGHDLKRIPLTRGEALAVLSDRKKAY